LVALSFGASMILAPSLSPKAVLNPLSDPKTRLNLRLRLAGIHRGAGHTACTVFSFVPCFNTRSSVLRPQVIRQDEDDIRFICGWQSDRSQ
jgi:hypothetical protein